MSDPINLPDIPWETVTFDPVVPRNVSRMEGRMTESQTFGTPYWRFTGRTIRLDEREYGKLDAFMMMAGDNGETFRAFDPFRPRPIAHDNGQPLSGTRAAGGAFDGTATITARTTTTLSVSGLPALFQFRAGDYAEVRKSPTLVSLHRLTADVQANASGIVTLPIRHNLDLGTFTLPLTLNLERASCLMQIEPGSYSASKGWNDRSPSLSAVEVFYG